MELRNSRLLQRKRGDANRRQRRRLGFTLVEILVVVVIIGMLAALVGPRLFGHAEKARVKTARAQMANFSTALDLYRLDYGRYPSSLEVLTQPSKETGESYMKMIPKTPWDSAYTYNVQNNGKDFVISAQIGDTGKTISTDDTGDDSVK